MAKLMAEFFRILWLVIALTPLLWLAYAMVLGFLHG
jgi:hypothetical protein